MYRRLIVPLLLFQPAFPQAGATSPSPRIERLQSQLRSNPGAPEQFWREVRDGGTPLIETLPEDSTDVLVTFLLSGGPDLRLPIIFASVLPNEDPLKQRLTHISGTDIWYRTYRFPRNLPILYELSGDGPQNLQRDPLNRKYIEGPMGGSVAILPGVRNLEWSRSQEVAHGRVDDVRFRSIQLRNERTVRVYLPPGFDQGDQYDLLVMMDEDVYSGPVPLATILDNLIAAKRIRPTVAVLVGSTNRVSELSCSPDFAAMLAQELVPWIQERYALRRRRTIIGGSSLGGLAAACAAWMQPKAFPNAISLSGSFRWRPRTESEPEWFARQLAASSLVDVRFFVGVGSCETGTPQEPANPSLLTANRHLRDVLRAKGYASVYWEFAGAHDALSWRTAIVYALVAVQE